MGQMQVLILGLRLMLTWAGGASSTMVDLSKMEGRWFHIFTASNKLELLSDYDHLSFYSPYFDCFSPNCDAISLDFAYSYQGSCRFVSKLMYKQGGNIYQTLGVPVSPVPPANILEVLDVGESVLLLGTECQSLSTNTYAILALCQERTLSEVDMEKFQKVLQQKEITAEPVRFTGNGFCRIGEE